MRRQRPNRKWNPHGREATTLTEEEAANPQVSLQSHTAQRNKVLEAEEQGFCCKVAKQERLPSAKDHRENTVFPIEQRTQRREKLSAKIKNKVCRTSSPKAGNKVCRTRFANPGAEEENSRQAVAQGQKQGQSDVVQDRGNKVHQTSLRRYM